MNTEGKTFFVCLLNRWNPYSRSHCRGVAVSCRRVLVVAKFNNCRVSISDFSAHTCCFPVEATNFASRCVLTELFISATRECSIQLVYSTWKTWQNCWSCLTVFDFSLETIRTDMGIGSKLLGRLKETYVECHAFLF